MFTAPRHCIDTVTPIKGEDQVHAAGQPLETTIEKKRKLEALELEPDIDSAPPPRKRRFDIVCELPAVTADAAESCERILFNPHSTIGSLCEEISTRFNWNDFELAARKGMDGIAFRLDKRDALQDVVGEDDLIVVVSKRRNPALKPARDDSAALTKISTSQHTSCLTSLLTFENSPGQAPPPANCRTCACSICARPISASLSFELLPRSFCTIVPPVSFFSVLRRILKNEANELHSRHKIVVVALTFEGASCMAACFQKAGHPESSWAVVRARLDAFKESVNGIVFCSQSHPGVGSATEDEDTTMVVYVGAPAALKYSTRMMRQMRKTSPRAPKVILLLTPSEREFISSLPLPPTFVPLSEIPGCSPTDLIASQNAIRRAISSVPVHLRKAGRESFLEAAYMAERNVGYRDELGAVFAL